MPRAYSDGFNKNNNPLPRLFPQIKAGGAGLMLDRLHETACKYRVHYVNFNPFGEDFQDIDEAIKQCEKEIPLRADFGDAIKNWIRTVVNEAWYKGYAVLPNDVISGIYAVAVELASADYTPQLAQVQARYGTYDSRHCKVPFSSNNT